MKPMQSFFVPPKHDRWAVRMSAFNDEETIDLSIIFLFTLTAYKEPEFVTRKLVPAGDNFFFKWGDMI